MTDATPELSEADIVRKIIQPSLTMTVAGNGMVGVAWSALFAAVAFGTGMGRPEKVGPMIVGLAMLRMMPPYLLAAVGYASVVKADRLAAAALVLAPLSGLFASMLGLQLTPALPLVELPLHLLTTITGFVTARRLLNSTPEELAQEAASMK
ncbi:MAG: hypothetical protein EP330_23550 [Deltaproteobacteria bacterium]|nr:MAG: hypothetical protein EP330_23550 [Deltaproteobacteria bacterium]